MMSPSRSWLWRSSKAGSLFVAVFEDLSSRQDAGEHTDFDALQLIRPATCANRQIRASAVHVPEVTWCHLQFGPSRF
jgi:hypothetical protein